MPDSAPVRAVDAAGSAADRYADAVRARRAELRTARDALAGGHRAELRTALALARLGAAEQLAVATAHLQGEARSYLDRCGRRDRRRFPGLLLHAVDGLRDRAGERHEAAVGAAARRIAAHRGLRIEPGSPAGAARQSSFRAPSPDPAVSRWTALAGGWRMALLPAAALPFVGLPVATAPALLGATGLGVAAAVVVGGHYTAAADRVRLRRWSDDVLAAVRADVDAALARLLIRVEQAAGAELDAAVARRRVEVDAELAVLLPAARRTTGAADDEPAPGRGRRNDG